MSIRAGIVVTGTEVLTGRVADANGPWLSEALLGLGVEHVWTHVVADRPDDVARALRAAREEGLDLVVTSGGLGPTEDDLTASVVAEVQGRPPALDEALEARIWAVLEPNLRRWPDLDVDALRAANRKQALVPTGATILEPVGTAPGLVVPPADGTGGPLVVVLPGPPSELRPMWPTAVATAPLRALLAGAAVYRTAMLRLYGIPESEIAKTMTDARAAGVDLDRLEITTCLRGGEVEVVTRWEPAEQATYDAFEAAIRERHADTLFSDDGSSVDAQVAVLLRDAGLTVATAESCTGGLLAGRLTALAGSSAYVRAGVVTYADDAKRDLLGVDEGLLREHGAVSGEVAAAMAEGARGRLGVDVAVATTGVAGPDGGSAAKPVGTVWFAVAGPDGRLVRRVRLPGDRGQVRERSLTVALHLLRRLLRGEVDAPSADAAHR